MRCGGFEPRSRVTYNTSAWPPVLSLWSSTTSSGPSVSHVLRKSVHLGFVAAIVVVCLVWGPPRAVLRAYPWLYSQGPLLLRGTYGVPEIYLKPVEDKENVFLTELALWL